MAERGEQVPGDRHGEPSALPIWQGAGATAGLLGALIVYGTWSGAPVPPEALAHFSPEELARGSAYHRPLYLGAAAVLALEGLLACWLFWHPAGRRLLGRLAGSSAPWAAAARLGAALTSLLVLLKLPLAYALGFVHPRRFSLLHASFETWLGSYALTGLLTVLGAALALGILYGLIARGGRWWLSAGLLLGCWLVAAAVLRPVVLDPLFHEFRPLAQGDLRDSIEALASDAGLAGAPIFVMDASRSTSRINAYVAGLGPTQRIVLFDTLVTDLDAAEATFIVAHELAHHHHAHAGLRLAGAVAGGLLFTCLLSWLLACRHHGGEGRLASPADPRGVPLVLLALLLVSFLTTPAAQGWSRAMERQADRAAVVWTGDAAAANAVHRAVAANNLADVAPHPVIYAFFFSHPTALERIAPAEGTAAPGAPQIRTRPRETAPAAVSLASLAAPVACQNLLRDDPWPRPPGV